jgi:hypothetical protein
MTNIMTFEFLTAVAVKSAIFLDVMLCSMLAVYGVRSVLSRLRSLLLGLFFNFVQHF